MKLPGHFFCPAGRAAFTLLELLVSLALTVVLMGAVGTSLSMFYRYRGLSQQNSLDATKRRGVLEDLSTDLRRLLPPTEAPRKPSGAQSFLARSLMVDETDISEQVLDFSRSLLIPDDAVARHPASLVGEREWLAVLVRGGNERFGESGVSGAQLHHVIWWNGRAFSAPLATRNGQPQPVAVPDTGGLLGLIRGERLFFERGTGTSESLRPVQVSAEIQRCVFRYFDGSRWYDRWNSEAEQRLPRLVECRLTWRHAAVEEVLEIRLPAGDH